MSSMQPELPDALLDAAMKAVKELTKEAGKTADDERLAQLDAKLPRFEGGDGFDGDIALTFDDGAELHAHTTILSQWSIVLSEAFKLQHGPQFEMKESSSHVWRAILSSMYPVDIDMDALDLEFWVAVLKEADRYEILVVKKRAHSHLVSKMSTEGIGKIVKLARCAASLNVREMMCECRKRLVDIIVPSDSPNVLSGNEMKGESFTAAVWDELENSVRDFPVDVLAELFSSVAQELIKVIARQKHDLEQRQSSHDRLQHEIRGLRNAIAEARCFVSKRSRRLCFKRTKRPVL